MGRQTDPPLDREIVFRSKIITGIAIAGVLLLLIVFTVPMALAGRGFHLSFYTVLPLVVWASTSLIWLVGWSGIRVRRDGVVVDNIVLRCVIPWEQFRGVAIDRSVGLTVRVAGRQPVRSISYGRSLAGSISGYSLMDATRGRIEAACQQAIARHSAVSPAPGFRRVIHFPVWIVVSILAYFEVVTWLSYFLHRL